jgi:hypothetical protein
MSRIQKVTDVELSAIAMRADQDLHALIDLNRRAAEKGLERTPTLREASAITHYAAEMSRLATTLLYQMEMAMLRAARD